MSKGADPYYNRKPVPDDFVEHVGYTGLTPQQEAENRERKYSVTGVDVRKFDKSDKGFSWHPQKDPHYGRKPVPDAMIHGVGETGLSKEEEFMNRERKYSVNGVDVRKFGSSGKGGWHPTDDPYYGRKAINKAEIDGVGETGMSRAEEFDTRENKAALFDESSDPFQLLSGRGSRASISAAAAPVATDARRRSSAVAPDAAAAVARTQHGHTSGYGGNDKLEIIPSHVEDNTIRPSSDAPTSTASTEVTHSDPTRSVGDTGHTTFYDAATKDLDSVGPRGEVAA